MGLIKDLIDPAFKERTVWVKYLDDFEIELRPMPRTEMVRMVERCTSKTWDKKTHLPVEKINSDLYVKEFVERGIVGWRGLKQKTLAKMLPIKILDSEAEIPFSPENAIEVMREAYDFDTFIRDAAMDISQFQEEKDEAELKNFESSQTG